MSASTPVLMIIFTFAFIPLILAEIARKTSLPSIEDFFVNSRKMPMTMAFFTVYATWVSSFAFLGATSYFYSKGPVYLTAFSWNALFGILFYVIGKRVWFYGKNHGYITPTDFFQDIYNSKILNLTITIIMVVFTIPYLQIQLSGGAYLIEIATNGMIPWRISGLLFYLIIIIYLWSGGIRAVALADIFYSIIIFISMLTVGFFLISRAGGIEYVYETILITDRNNLVLPGPEGDAGILLWLAMFVIVPIGALMGPQLWIRFYAIGQKKTFHIMPLLITLAAIMYLGSVLSGSASIILKPGVEQADKILPSILADQGNQIFTAFLFCGIASAALSTANSQIHAVAAIYTIDIHKRYINKSISDARLVNIGKWAVLFISAIAYILLLNSPSLIIDTGTIAMGGTAQIMVPTVGALFWKRSNSNAAVCGLTSGVLILVILFVASNLTSSYCAIIALFCNMVIFIIGSLIFKTNIYSREKILTYKNEYENNEK